MAVSAQHAHLILVEPKQITDGTLEWEVLTSVRGGHELMAVIQFAVHVDHVDLPGDLREMVVRGEMKGDYSHNIWLRTPRSNDPIVRLCSASHHAEGAHWHWDELSGVEGGRVEPPPEVDLSDPASSNREEMIANFCARLNISGMFVQGSIQ